MFLKNPTTLPHVLDVFFVSGFGAHTTVFRIQIKVRGFKDRIEDALCPSSTSDGF